jgi:SAM-dependent methyltransferase
MAYNAMDAAEHLARYAMLRSICVGKRVLDVACGEGYGSYLLAQWGAASVTAVDISAEAIAKAKANFPAQNVAYLEGDVCRLSEAVPPSARFDLICSFETIEHLADPKAFLASLAAVRTDDCVIAISAPNDQLLGEVSTPHHLHRFDLESFRAITEAALGPAGAWMLGAPFQGYLLATERGLETPAEEEDMRRSLRLRSYGPLDLIPPQRGNSPHTGNVSFWMGVWGHASVPVAVAAPQSMTSWQEPWRALDFFKQRKSQLERDLEEGLSDIRSLEIKLAEERRQGLVTRTLLDELKEKLGELKERLVEDSSMKAILGELKDKLAETEPARVAVEVWRERRRRRLPFKMWNETCRAWRRVKRKLL